MKVLSNDVAHIIKQSFLIIKFNLKFCKWFYELLLLEMENQLLHMKPREDEVIAQNL